MPQQNTRPCPICASSMHAHARQCNACYIASRHRTRKCRVCGSCLLGDECRACPGACAEIHAAQLDRGRRSRPALNPTPEDRRPRYGWVVLGRTVAWWRAGSLDELAAGLEAHPRPAGASLWRLEPWAWCLLASEGDPLVLIDWLWQVATEGEVPVLSKRGGCPPGFDPAGSGQRWREQARQRRRAN